MTSEDFVGIPYIDPFNECVFPLPPHFLFSLPLTGPPLCPQIAPTPYPFP